MFHSSTLNFRCTNGLNSMLAVTGARPKNVIPNSSEAIQCQPIHSPSPRCLGLNTTKLTIRRLKKMKE
jgi:hypothetical protein